MATPLIGSANEDKNVATSTTTAGSATTSTNVTSVTSTTALNNVEVTGKQEVGIRKNNPLGNFSSSTYHLTLYMVSPDAYNAFIKSGRKNINAKTPGAYIIAQSGGTPKSDPSTRAAGFELDFYIDNLRIDTVLPAACPTTTKLSFSITEPYGFSFISKLNIALDKIRSVSTIPGYSTSKSTFNPTRQFFILSVGFRGYDSNGKVMTNAEIGSQNALSTANGEIFDHFYEILITSMKFKLDGKETKYDITAATLAPTTAFGINRGTVANEVTITAADVADALGGKIGTTVDAPGVRGLMTQLNDAQKKLANPPVDVKNQKSEASQPRLQYPNEYWVDWRGSEEDQKRFKKSLLMSQADIDKGQSPGAPVKNSDGSNEKTAQKASYDSTMKNVSIRSGTSIVAAITQIIKLSSWIEDSLKLIQASKEEMDSETENAVSNPTSTEFSWFNISSDIEIIGWNDQQNDFAYKIIYYIEPFAIPATSTSFSKAPKKYYGAHKRYDYWLTGKNSEVIKIEQQFDNAYFNTMYMGTVSNDGSGVQNNPDFRTNVEQQGRAGVGTVTHDATVAFLRDPNAYTKTKIQIMGDPDYLMPDSVQKPGYYAADGYTMNPSSGQRFIEIAYKEAQDYMNSTGTLKVNGNVQFWPYPPNVQVILNGAMSYMLVSVTSNFNKGAFTQDLTTAINTFPNYDITLAPPGRGASSEGTAGESAAKANMTGTTLNSTLATNVTSLTASAQSAVNKVTSQITIPTINGPVASDDAMLSQTNKASGV